MINDRVIQSPFAWYTSQQFLEGKSGLAQKNGWSPFMLAPNDRFLPFQIRVLKSGTLTLSSLQIVSCSGVTTDLSSYLSSIAVESDAVYYYIIYKGDIPIPGLSISEGLYNLQLATTLGTFYSEAFCAKSAAKLAKLFKVEWWSTCDFSDGSPVRYSSGYKNILYLDADMLAPKLELEEDSEKDGYGNPIPIMQRFIWRYRLSTDMLLQSTAFAMCSISMHSDNLITLPDGRSTKMEQVKPDLNAQELGAFVVLEFQEETILKTACCGGPVSGGTTGGTEFSSEFSSEFN